MGNLGQKCSCLGTKTANNPEDSVDIDQKTNPTSKSMSRNSKRIEKPYLFDGMGTRSKKSEIMENFENDDYHMTKEERKKFLRLQAYIRGCYMRIQFYSGLKQKLKSLTRKIVEKYKSEFRTVLQYKAENIRGMFDPNGWAKYYSQDSSYLFNYEQKYYGSFLLKAEILIYNETSYYIGTVNIRNQRCGFGVFANLDGEKYEGNWVNNKFTGWGRYIDTEGNLFEGYFLNNTLNGKGEKHSLNGSSYFGEFKNNLRHGKGREETTEHYYEGDFRKDRKEGLGKLVYKGLQDSYEGEFKDNCITGSGFYRWTNGDTYSGTFVNGKMHGRGVYKWPDGGEYEGDYIDNIKEGFGVFKWTNGRIFKGPFKSSKPHGSGIMTVEKDTYEVIFQDGKLVKSVKLEGIKLRDKDALSNCNTNRSIVNKGQISPNSTNIGSSNRKGSEKSEIYRK